MYAAGKAGEQPHMSPDSLSRRRLLQKLTLGVPLLPLAAYRVSAALAADAPLLSPEDKEAKAVKYVEDASKAQGALPGSTCANCALYQGHSGAPAGACQIFPGKQVKAAGWCSSWAPQM
jgi:High potential iron-sulfur protein